MHAFGVLFLYICNIIKTLIIMENNPNGQTSQAFSFYYRNYRSVIFDYISRHIPYSHDVEDLVQDVFVRFFECGESVRNETVKSFLFAIARNRVIDYVRCSKRNRMEDIEEYRTEDTGVTVEQAFIAKELSSVLRLQIVKLPKRRREVYRMIEYGERPVSEVAECLGLNRRTVENHLYKARSEIRSRIRACWG